MTYSSSNKLPDIVLYFVICFNARSGQPGLWSGSQSQPCLSSSCCQLNVALLSQVNAAFLSQVNGGTITNNLSIQVNFIQSCATQSRRMCVMWEYYCPEYSQSSWELGLTFPPGESCSLLAPLPLPRALLRIVRYSEEQEWHQQWKSVCLSPVGRC